MLASCWPCLWSPLAVLSRSTSRRPAFHSASYHIFCGSAVSGVGSYGGYDDGCETPSRLFSFTLNTLDPRRPVLWSGHSALQRRRLMHPESRSEKSKVSSCESAMLSCKVDGLHWQPCPELARPPPQFCGLHYQGSAAHDAFLFLFCFPQPPSRRTTSSLCTTTWSSRPTSRSSSRRSRCTSQRW
jgi:hypothetical protein